MIKMIILLICVLGIVYNYSNHRFISSSSVWLLCYLLIFVAYPILEEKTFENAFLIDVLALFGAICFLMGLTFGSRLVVGARYSYQKYYIEKDCFPNFNVARVLFVLSFALSIVVLIYVLGTSGISAIIAGTKTSKQFALGDEGSNLYIFSVHLLVPCILAMWISSSNKKQKIQSIVALGLYIIETVLFGFTRLFLITIVVIIVFYEVRNLSRRKQLIIGALGIVGIFLIMVSLNFIRCLGLKNYSNIKNYVDLSYVFESTDFGGSYYYFNDILNYDPPYINLSVYLKPVFAIIPRSIWETKPEPLSLQVLKYTNPALAATGYSTAGNSVLGEGYAVLGYIGVFLFPFIWGTICGKLDKRYYCRLENGIDSSLSNIFYYIFSVFIVISGQRGDWSQYMTIVIWFYMLPLFIMSKVTIRFSK